MSECNFHVGQKVVLVDDKWPRRTYDAQIRRPEKGGIYTIRGIRISLVAERGGERPCLLLNEIVNPEVIVTSPQGRGFGEPAFDFSRFRPVLTRQTNISVFKAMLTPSKEQVDA